MLQRVFGVGLLLLAMSAQAQEVDLTILQGTRRITVESGSRVELDRAPFTMEFPLPDYDPGAGVFAAAKISVALSAAQHDGLEVGRAAPDYFMPGTGMAPDTRDGYSALFPSAFGHHYVMYSRSDPSARRARLVRQLPTGENLVRWLITGLYIEDLTPLAESVVQALHIAFYLDEGNGLIDNGEVIRFTIGFAAAVAPEITELPTEVAFVATGGFWEIGSRYGSYRVIVANSGFARVVSQLYIQWLEADPARGAIQVNTTLPVFEINTEAVWSVNAPQLRHQAGQTLLTASAIHSYAGTKQEWRLRLGEPGLYSVIAPD